MENILKDKNILVMGVRNKWSIAWGIAEFAMAQGANVLFTYLGDREKEALEKLVEDFPGAKLYSCDVSSDEAIDDLFTTLQKDYILHGLVHAIAHARSEDLQNAFINTSREGFAHAMNISAYSLLAVSRRARELMTEGGSILTLSYYGADKVIPGYNVMGVAKAALEASVRYLAFDLGTDRIRVNAISAGPVKTLSAMGVQNFGDILNIVRDKAPLHRNVSLEELGSSAVFLLSDLSAAVTGQVIYVDSGYSIMGI